MSGMASEARGKTIAKIVAVALIVGLFSAFYCWSFWDPVGAMKRVPIGIVNLDEGVEVNGKQVNIGSGIADSAVEGSDANFVELDEQALADGVENSGYSMVFEIPADFSSKVAAGMTDVPQAADLEIYKNIRYNYIYAQLSTQIEKAFEGSVNSAIANAYVTGAYSGLEQARDGLQEASEGSGKLADGASPASEGITTLSSGASSDDMGAYVADPTSVNEEKYGSLDYYGQGFSPFFMTTSLWLGALIIFFVIEPLWPKSRHAGCLRTVVGRLPFYALVCAFEAAAVALFAWGIGVLDAHSASPLLLFAYALGVSLSFMLIMQFLNMTLGVIGKALAVLTLIFQLACSGGTLPVDLGQSFVAALNPFLPFTYAIDGFREVITYANGATIAVDLGTTVAFGLAFFVLSLATWGFAERRRDAEMKSTLAWNREEEPEGETGPGIAPSAKTAPGTVSPIGQRACSE